MAKKPSQKSGNQNDHFQLPDMVTHDFEQERDILTRKPDIHYEEPIADDFYQDPQEISPTSLEDARQEVDNLIKSYKAVEQLSALAQERIDKRVGNYTVSLDPEVDASVIDAIQRSFPEAKDPTKITYEMYKQCLARVDKSTLPQISDQDLVDAKKDPLKTNFSGYGNPSGMNRPEVSSPARVVDPIDLKKFRQSAVKNLFELLQSFNIPYIEWRFKRHLLTEKHG